MLTNTRAKRKPFSKSVSTLHAATFTNMGMPCSRFSSLVGLVTHMPLKRWSPGPRDALACHGLGGDDRLTRLPSLAYGLFRRLGFPIFSDQGTLNVPSPTADPGGPPTVSNICKEDHLFWMRSLRTRSLNSKVNRRAFRFRTLANQRSASPEDGVGGELCGT
jgi:hypothetical protein